MGSSRYSRTEAVQMSVGFVIPRLRRQQKPIIGILTSYFQARR